MGLPEYCYQGGTLYITGRVLEDVNVIGWEPYIKFKNGASFGPVLGVWSDVSNREFFFQIPKEQTALFPLGTLNYEIYIELPSDEVFVVSRGSLEVVPRL